MKIMPINNNYFRARLTRNATPINNEGGRIYTSSSFNCMCDGYDNKINQIALRRDNALELDSFMHSEEAKKYTTQLPNNSQIIARGVEYSQDDKENQKGFDLIFAEDENDEAITNPDNILRNVCADNRLNTNKAVSWLSYLADMYGDNNKTSQQGADILCEKEDIESSHNREIEKIVHQKDKAIEFDKYMNSPEVLDIISNLPDDDEIQFHNQYSDENPIRGFDNMYLSYIPNNDESIDKYNDLSDDEKSKFSKFPVDRSGYLERGSIDSWIDDANAVFGEDDLF